MSVRAALQGVSELAALLDGRRFADLSDAELVGSLSVLGSARRLLDAIGIDAAAEVDDRCQLEDGRSLSRAFGAKTPADVLAAQVGLSLGEARTWCSLADAVRPRISLTGEVLPARFSAVSDALAAGIVAVPTADLIVRTVDEVRPFLSPDDVLGLERLLVEKAPQFSCRDFTKLCRAVPEDLFPAGVEMREDLQRARSGIRITQRADGTEHWDVILHPEAAGIMGAAMGARTAPRRQPEFQVDPEADDLATRDTRTLAQRRLGVVPRQVVQSGDGRDLADGGVGSVLIVEVQPGGES